MLTLFTDREETLLIEFSVEIYNNVYLSKLIKVTSFTVHYCTYQITNVYCDSTKYIMAITK